MVNEKKRIIGIVLLIIGLIIITFEIYLLISFLTTYGMGQYFIIPLFGLLFGVVLLVIGLKLK